MSEPTGLMMAMRALAGGAAGGLMGRYALPPVMGYEQDPQSVNISTALNTATGAGLGAFGHMLPRDPRSVMGVSAAIAGEEMIPFTRDILKSLPESINRLDKPTITDQAGGVLSTPEARGAMVGAGGAGLAAILSGLARRRTQSEETNENSRGRMVVNDLAKYVLPAMLAGGAAGHYAPRSHTQAEEV